MKTIDEWLTLYGRDHQNPVNKRIHWICVPVILFTIFGLFLSIPFPEIAGGWVNPATLAWALALLFYARLSIPIFLGMLFTGGIMIWVNLFLQSAVLPHLGLNLLQFSLIVFVLAWIFQFIGHQKEGQKPSFFEDLQFLLIGPAWILHFVYKKAGIPYK